MPARSIEINSLHVVPIISVDVQWEVKDSVCERNQLTLMPAFAKGQGLTLASFVLNFEDKGFTSGLGYAVLSRVSPIRDVRIETQLQFWPRKPSQEELL